MEAASAKSAIARLAETDGVVLGGEQNDETVARAIWTSDLLGMLVRARSLVSASPAMGGSPAGSRRRSACSFCAGSVSYTHLTLPTIYSV